MSSERQVQFDGEGFLAKHPVFGLRDLAEAMGARKTSALYSWVKYHVATGRLRQVERGLYAPVPPGVDGRAFAPDAFLVGVTAREDSVFAYHSALQLLGAAHSVFHAVAVFTSRRRRPLRVGNVRVEFASHPAPFVQRRAVGLGVREVRYRDRALRATGPERTLVEGFRKPQLVGGLEELIQSAGGFSSLDLDLLRAVLKAYNQKALWGAVGWFLEQYHRTFRVPEEYLRTLERGRPTSPHYLPRRQRGKGGVFVSRWNLVLPEPVVSLREPNES